jgi:cytochrome bd-type quinol oxidase subunit 2
MPRGGGKTMESLLRLAIILVFLAIVASLGSALFHLVRAQGDSRKLARALTIRVSLSLALFILLMLAWYAGLISPHGLPAR